MNPPRPGNSGSVVASWQRPGAAAMATRDTSSSRASTKHRLTISALGAALFWLGACFYGPPILPTPRATDSPPFVLGFDPDITVDLRDPGEVKFAIDAIYDVNEPEEIRYRVLFRLDPQGPTEQTLREGTLLPRETQTFKEVTEYIGPEVSLDPCTPPLRGADGDIRTLTLELVDPLPEAQQQDGLEAFVVKMTWRIRLTGTCPGG